MKIEVAKPDLEAALQVVSIGTSSTGSDITTHFVFRCRNKDMVEVFSNNNRLGISMPLAGCRVVEGEPGDAFTVEAKRLNKVLAAQGDVVLGLSSEKKGLITVMTAHGPVTLQGLDPSSFPHWDEALESVKEGTKIAAKRLHAAFNHVKLYISDKETVTPKIAVTEIRKESLQATDGGALTVITIPDLANSNLRIHGRDLGPVLAFLGAVGDGNVELREHDRCLFLVREDGGVLSVGRPHHAFPEISLDKKPHDPHWWVVRTEDLLRAIKTLEAVTSEEDKRMSFNFRDGMVTLTMTSAASTRDTLRIEAQEHGSLETTEIPMPKDGFDIAYPYLLKLLGKTKGEILKFGLNPNIDKKTGQQKGGWVRFREDRDGDDFLTLLVWQM
jgi:DNA polymerase III sliding clamp (beta) subunit (PCNA family)